MLQLLVSNATSRARIEHLDGKEYYVVNAVTIVPGVLPGSKGPMLYTPNETEKHADAWNGMPIVLNHPTDGGGRPTSARQPSVIRKYGLGTVYATNYDGTLNHEAWFDVQATQKKAPSVFNALQKGEPIELSTGLYTNESRAPKGATWNGEGYEWVAHDMRPDHLAILTHAKGACSNDRGCGINHNEETVNGGPCSGRRPGTPGKGYGGKPTVIVSAKHLRAGDVVHHPDTGTERTVKSDAQLTHRVYVRAETNDRSAPVNTRADTKLHIVAPTHNAFADPGQDQQDWGSERGDHEIAGDTEKRTKTLPHKYIETVNTETIRRSIWQRLGDMLFNAGKHGNPQDGDTGKFLRHGAGTGKGPVHQVAKHGMCPDCGGPLDANGICAKCATQNAVLQDDWDRETGTPMKHADGICPQCGAPVDPQTGYCKACAPENQNPSEYYTPGTTPVSTGTGGTNNHETADEYDRRWEHQSHQVNGDGLDLGGQGTFMDKYRTYNREWPQEKRDKLSEEDFAGPGRSFPIQTQADVDAAIHAVGRSKHDPDTIKAGIKRIAKRKGLKLPPSLVDNDDEASEGGVQGTGMAGSPLHIGPTGNDWVDYHQNAADVADKAGDQLIANWHRDNALTILENPTGVNQYSKGGKNEAHNESKKAFTASKDVSPVKMDHPSFANAGKALEASKTGDHKAASEAHLSQMNAHVVLASRAKSLGDAKYAAQHLDAAKAHRDAAMAHQHSQITGNNYSETTAMDRKGTISQLTQNCKCFEGAERTLNALTDAQLEEISRNAMVANTVKKPIKVGGKTLTFNGETFVDTPKSKLDKAKVAAGYDQDDLDPEDGGETNVQVGPKAKIVKNADGEDDEDEDEPEEDEEDGEGTAKTKKEKGKKMTKNEVDEYLAKAPVPIRNVVLNALRQEAKQKRELIGKLKQVAESTNNERRKKLITNKLKDPEITVNALEELLDLVGPPTVNSAPLQLMPRFDGGDAEVPVVNADDDEGADFLDMPTTNWEKKATA